MPDRNSGTFNQKASGQVSDEQACNWGKLFVQTLIKHGVNATELPPIMDRLNTGLDAYCASRSGEITAQTFENVGLTNAAGIVTPAGSGYGTAL